MKKTLLFAFLLLGTVFSQAQNISKNALGLRLGDNDGFGGEVSYQRGLSKNNRLEFDLGWRTRTRYGFNNGFGNDNFKGYDNRSVKLVGLYQWVWNIDGGFNWYAGVGGGLANDSYNYNYNFDGNTYRASDSYTYALVAGDIGIEYNFDFPLQLSIDFGPEIYFTDKVQEDFGPDVGLGVRYKF